MAASAVAFAAPPAEACAPGPQGSGETDFGPDRIVRNSYDAAGQLLRIEEAYGVTVANGFPATQQQEVASYTYSPNGRRTSLTDGNGNRAEMMWDGHDRQRRWVFPSPAAPGQANPADYEEYGYDAAGNRTSLRKRDGRTIAFAYDALNRLIARTYPQGGARAVHYGYGLRGEQLYARFDSPAGEGVTNAYDAFGRLASSRIDLGGVARTLSYRYDEAGNRTRLTHPDGQYFEYRHDALGRFTGIRENGYSDVVGQSWHPTGERFILGRTGTAMGWLYDAIGRPRLLVDDLPDGAGTTWTFERNPASQIVAAARTNDAYAWTGHYPVARAYAANGLNQYSAAGGASFAYDANGNLTSDGSRSYGYDIENRLVGASSGPSTGSGGTLTLAYDPLGRLFQTSGGASGTTRFLYDGDDLIAEYDGAGALLRRYVHGPGADEPLLRYEGAGVALANRRHLVADWQGSIVAITDATGNRLSLNAYDEYGIPAATNSGRFQYTGQIWLPDLGMYHYKARVYSPTLGRFLQTDPIGYDDQLNLYAYVANDPVNHTDPDGKQVRVTLVGYPLPDFPAYGHAYILYRDVRTGEMRITRAGPLPAYAGGSSGAATNSADGRSRLVAVDTTIPRSVDRPVQNPGSRVLDTAVVPGNMQSIRSQVEAFNREVNEQRNAYLPVTRNSNAYAGDAFERLTGREAEVNSDVQFPGVNTTHVIPQPVCTWLVRDQGCRR